MAININGSIKMISGVMGTFSSIASAKKEAANIRSLGQYEANAARFQGQAADQAYQLNALISEDNAELSLISGEKDRRDRMRRTEREVGAAAVGFAGAGVNVSTGTPLLVLSNLASEGAMEAVKLKHEKQNDARNLRNDAVLQRFAGQQAILTGEIVATGAIARSEAQADAVDERANKTLFDSLGSLTGLFGG